MENKLGRKSMQDWQAMTDALTARVYKSGYDAGYNDAKDETLSVDDMAGLLVERYNDEGLSNLMMIVDKIRPRRVDRKFRTVKRKAKVGERIWITNPGTTFGDYDLGSILTVIDDNYRGGVRIKEVLDASYINHFEYEVIIENHGHVSVKSPNQQRAELIEKAREFVESLKHACGEYKIYAPIHSEFVEARFIVNEAKRTVVCLLSPKGKDYWASRGIAKCMPGEVFNADIGKAIALARALEIDVPAEFLQAVQPDEKVVGMIINVPDSLYGNYAIVENNVVALSGNAHAESINGKAGKIIDDTNARYPYEVTP